MGARRAFGQREQKRQMAGGGTRKQAWNQSLLEAKSQPPSGPFFLQKKAQLFLPPEQLRAGQSCHWSSQSHITRGVQVARTLLSLSSRRGLRPSGWGSGQRVVCVCVCVHRDGGMSSCEGSAQSWGTIVRGSLLSLPSNQILGTKCVQ